MDLTELLINAHTLLDKATIEDGLGLSNSAILYLVELRTLLNDQPTLEAGGANET